MSKVDGLGAEAREIGDLGQAYADMMKRIGWMMLVLSMWLSSIGMVSADWQADLPESPTGIGKPATDREWWGKLAASEDGKKAIQRAVVVSQEEMTVFDRERYLDFQNNGDRMRYQTQHSQRWGRFKTLVLGECLEGKKRFIPAIDVTVRSLCSDPSWILPAHDKNAKVLDGAPPYVDLAVATSGYEMALATWLLADSLSPEILGMMKENVMKRLVLPVYQTMDGSAPDTVKKGHWWMQANQNWNAVCTAGFVGAVCVLEPSKAKRAEVIRLADRQMDVFLSGFTNDGYCSEGMAYWNYGFGHFMVLAECVKDQTHGVVDFYQKPKVKAIIDAPTQLQMQVGIAPAYADCSLDVKPDVLLMEVLRQAYAADGTSGQGEFELQPQGYLYQILWYSQKVPKGRPPRLGGDLPLRSWFGDSGVYVGRSRNPNGLLVSWKGGHNGEHHNHNDVGTTVVAWKGKSILLDPGAMVYRAETFSKDRYRLPMMSSYGHAVPVVAGKLQTAGSECRGRLEKRDFTDGRDVMVMDIASAYPTVSLKTLQREWQYDRRDLGKLTMEDRWEMADAGGFATSLVSTGDWYQSDVSGPRAVFFVDAHDGAVLRVETECSGDAVWLVEKLDNPGKVAVYRLGGALKVSSPKGTIKMHISPAIEGVPTGAIRMPVTRVIEKLQDAAVAP